jgi:HlyD family secretion protein
MDPEKLKALQIKSEAKGRPRGSIWSIFLGVAVITVVALYFAWPRKDDGRRVVDTQGKAGKPSATSAAPASVPATAAPAAGRVEGSILTATGYIINRERIEISPRFLGQVKWIGVRKGDPVTNGQVVVLLDDAEQKARVAEAEGRLANARAAQEKARLDYDRTKRLIADKIETPEKEDDARLRVEATAASVKEAEGTLAVARTYLDWTVIRSSIDGVVLEKLADAGELVTPQSFGGGRGPSTAVLAVADPKDLQVEIDLNESDVAKVFRQQRCKVSPEAYPDKVYDGYVAEVAPEANRQKGTLEIKVQILNPDHFLTPELSAKVDFLAKNGVAAK